MKKSALKFYIRIYIENRMKTRVKIIIVILVLSTSFAYTQQNDSCRVIVKEISGTYKGDCKYGVADGDGVAKGKDTYTGKFKDGFPDGKGTYVYENGNNFTGTWVRGLKSGFGKFIYYVEGKEYVQKGYWKNDEYVGISNPDEFYKLAIEAGAEDLRCSVKKVQKSGERIYISFAREMSNYIPSNLRITTTSGRVVQEGEHFAIYNYADPNNCTISFTVRVLGEIKTCSLSLDILKMGNYELLVTTN